MKHTLNSYINLQVTPVIYRNRGSAVGAAIDIGNRIASNSGCGFNDNGGPNCDMSDPQGCVGRPDFSEGDAYSGDQNFGDCDGR